MEAAWNLELRSASKFKSSRHNHFPEGLTVLLLSRDSCLVGHRKAVAEGSAGPSPEKVMHFKPRPRIAKFKKEFSSKGNHENNRSDPFQK